MKTFCLFVMLAVCGMAQIVGPQPIPTGLPPTGACGGDLTGTEPNCTIKASVSLTTPNIGVATGTSLTAALTDAGGQVYNVKNYGAVGDGTTNDQPAFAAAHAAAPEGAAIYIPCGNYKMSTTWAITKVLTTQGEGYCSNVTGSAITIVSAINVGTAASRNGPVFQNMRISDATGNSATIGLNLSGSVNAVVQGVQLITSGKLGTAITVNASVISTYLYDIIQGWNVGIAGITVLSTVQTIGPGTRIIANNIGLKFDTVGGEVYTLGATIESNTTDGIQCNGCQLLTKSTHWENGGAIDIKATGSASIISQGNIYANGVDSIDVSGTNNRIASYGDQSLFLNQNDATAYCEIYEAYATNTYAGTGPCRFFQLNGVTTQNLTTAFTYGTPLAVSNSASANQGLFTTNRSVANSFTSSVMYVQNTRSAGGGHAGVTIDKGAAGVNASVNFSDAGTLDWDFGTIGNDNFGIRNLVGTTFVPFTILNTTGRIGLGPGNTTPGTTVDITDKTASTGATRVVIGLGAADSGTTTTLTNNGSTSTVALAASGAMTAPNLAASSAAQTGTLCWTTGTGNFTVDTTTTCLLSAGWSKQEVSPAIHGLDWVMQMKPSTWKYKPQYQIDGDKFHLGFVADDLAAIDAGLFGAYDNDGKIRNFQDRAVMATAVKAIQEQQAEIDSLKADVARLSR